MHNIKIKNISIILLITILSMIAMVFCGISYETNDDWAMAWQMSGREDGIATFLSPVLSKIISFFYSYKEISWWLLLTLFCIACCLFSIYYYIYEMYSGKIKYIILLLCAICVWITGVQTINFTRTAMLLGVCGCLWIFGFHNDQNKMKLCCGLLFVLVGSMIRYEAVIAVLPILILYYAFETINSKIKLRVFMPVIFVFGIMLVIYIVNCLYWNTHLEWRQYLEYNSKRAEIQDYSEQYPQWEDGEELYKNIGFLEGDEKMILEKWFSEDTGVYSLDNLEKMLEMKNTNTDIIKAIKETLNVIFSSCMWWINCILLFLTIRRTMLYRRIEVLVINGYIIGAIFLFCLRGRIMERVSEPLILAGILTEICILGFYHINASEGLYITVQDIDTKKKYKISLDIGIAILIGIVVMSKELLLIPTMFQVPHFYNGIDENARQEMDYMNDNADKIYILPATVHNWDKSFGIWERIHKEYCNNVFFLGGWEARAPYNIERLQNYGIGNPVESLVELSNVYSAYSIDVWQYLRRHYGNEVTCSRVESFSGTDDNSVVAYTLPVEKKELFEKEDVDINIEQFETQTVDNNIGKVLNGCISENNVKELYYNIEVEGQTYTYRLNMSVDGLFYGFLYDFEKFNEQKIEQGYLWGKSQSGKNIYLGEISD